MHPDAITSRALCHTCFCKQGTINSHGALAHTHTPPANCSAYKPTCTQLGKPKCSAQAEALRLLVACISTGRSSQPVGPDLSPVHAHTTNRRDDTHAHADLHNKTHMLHGMTQHNHHLFVNHHLHSQLPKAATTRMYHLVSPPAF